MYRKRYKCPYIWTYEGRFVNIHKSLPQEWHGCFSELWRPSSNVFFLKDEKTWGHDWFGTTEPPKIA
jgi:hypothetical protein